jgi:putative NIF3 family GTP cyclohydrolase 1 type 2
VERFALAVDAVESGIDGVPTGGLGALLAHPAILALARCSKQRERSCV